VESYILLGLHTGIASIIPILSTMTIYVLICLIAFATVSLGNAIGLTLYCFFLVAGIDNILRFTILKTIGNVHPMITVFGVLLGLNLFVMLGIIFGPLILSSIGVLVKVYSNEYGKGIVRHYKRKRIVPPQNLSPPENEKS